MKAKYIIAAIDAMEKAMDCKEIPVENYCQLSKARGDLMAYSGVMDMEIWVENETL
jgi:hypothetical protein